jgi:hypothetical protein
MPGTHSCEDVRGASRVSGLALMVVRIALLAEPIFRGSAECSGNRVLSV